MSFQCRQLAYHEACIFHRRCSHTQAIRTRQDAAAAYLWTTAVLLPSSVLPQTSLHSSDETSLEMTTMTPVEAALKLSMTLPQPIDVKFWIFSKRIRIDGSDRDGTPSSVQASHPLHVFAISSVLKHTEYFKDCEPSQLSSSTSRRLTLCSIVRWIL